MKSHTIDTELVSRIITNLKPGKAMNIDRLLSTCNFVIQLYLLKKLFHLMINCSFVPDGF